MSCQRPLNADRDDAHPGSPMYTLTQLAQHVDGEIAGDPEIQIEGVNPFGDAGPADITVAFSKGYLQRLHTTSAAAVIVPPGTQSPGKALLKVQNPKLAFARILHLFTEKPFEPLGVSHLASIGERCQIADAVSIHSFVSIGADVSVEDGVTMESGVVVGDGCKIGAGATLHANVVLYPGISIGKRVTLHGGVVLGADGFGYVFDGQTQVKMPQTGSVVIHDDVEIGANSCVDRATFGATVIERGVKLDNHVHIAHNCRIGENTVIAGCVGISGSVTVGRNCVFAGQCGTVDHVTIGDDVMVLARAVITKDIPSGSVISGSYGRDHRLELKQEAMLRRLPQIYRDWKARK